MTSLKNTFISQPILTRRNLSLIMNHRFHMDSSIYFIFPNWPRKTEMKISSGVYYPYSWLLYLGAIFKNWFFKWNEKGHQKVAIFLSLFRIFSNFSNPKFLSYQSVKLSLRNKTAFTLPWHWDTLSMQRLRAMQISQGLVF